MGPARIALSVAAALTAVPLLAPDAAVAQSPPVIEGEGAGHVTQSDASLEAKINTEGAEPGPQTGAWYQFQLVRSPGEYQAEFRCPEPLDPSQCFGIPVSAGSLPVRFLARGSGGQAVSLDLASAGRTLSPGTTYHFRVIAANRIISTDTIQWAPPIVYGPDQMFTTAPAPVPTIESESASNITSSDATLEAHIKTEGLQFGAWYQFQVDKFPSEIECPPLERIFPADGCGPGPQVQTAPPIGFVSGGSADQLASLDLARSGMIVQPETTYSYRVLAAPSAPPGDTIQWVPPPVAGPIQTFTTPPTPSPPGVSTAGAFAIGPTTAIVDGTAEPKGESTTVRADYALAGEPWCTSNGAEGSPAETEPQSIGSINGVISEIVVKLEGLTPRREYCVELVAANESGTAFGGQVRFTTPKKARHRHWHQ